MGAKGLQLHFSGPTLPKLNQASIEQLEMVANAFVAITSELDRDGVLQVIADAARQISQATYAALGVVDETGRITAFITSGISSEEREQIGELPRGHGLLGALIKEGRPVRIPRIQSDPRSCGFPPHHPPMDSFLGVPVSIQGRVVGDLYVTSKQGADEFSPEDEWRLIIFARQAAIAIANADLYYRLQVAQDRAQTLATLTSNLNRSTNPNELLAQVNQATRQLLNLDASALYLLDPEQHCFRFETQFGMRLDQNDALNLPLQGSVAGQALLQNRSITIENTATLSRTFFLHLADGQLPGALIVVPIRQNGKITGVLEGYTVRLRQFSLEEIALLEAFADHAALALEKAQLYQQKEEFLSMTSHDLRAPLTAIQMSAGLLEANLPDNLPPALSRLVASISRNSQRLDYLIRDLLDLSRLEQGHLQLQTSRVQVVGLVAMGLESLATLFQEKNQVVKFERPTTPYWVEADQHRLEQALVNLISNANKYAPAGGQVTIKIEPEPNQQWINIRIKDSGSGIPLSEQTQIFNRYYRRPLHEQSQEAVGSGLGLPIARYLVELHGGQLSVESNPTVQPGTCFVMRLPLLPPSPSN